MSHSLCSSRSKPLCNSNTSSKLLVLAVDSKDDSKGDVEAREARVAAVVAAMVDASGILPLQL